jgi:hypothetical protein
MSIQLSAIGPELVCDEADTELRGRAAGASLELFAATDILTRLNVNCCGREEGVRLAVRCEFFVMTGRSEEKNGGQFVI